LIYFYTLVAAINFISFITFIVSLKSFLQNITLGNETNLGFKVVSNEKNDPFESIHFDIENESAKPILEIIYVAN